MKKALIIITLALLACGIFATDFTLTDGTVIIGQLKGISAEKMYVLDSLNMLHVLSFTQIQSINDGSGDVSTIWKRKKPFMDINPQAYQTTQADQNTKAPDLLAPPPPMQKTTDQHLASISTALWTLNGIYVASVIVAILTYIHITK